MKRSLTSIACVALLVKQMAKPYAVGPATGKVESLGH